MDAAADELALRDLSLRSMAARRRARR
uniref:Uncharacterized protein n=1 Tax=Arundo donax TaxID=35708 RepID=A0A0A8ZEH0_ARUDO